MCSEYVLKVFKEWVEKRIRYIHANTKEGSYDREYGETPYLAMISLITAIENSVKPGEAVNIIKEYLRASCALYDTSLKLDTLFPECLYGQAFKLMYINFCATIQESKDGEL